MWERQFVHDYVLGFSCPFTVNPWRYVNYCHAMLLNCFPRSSRCIVDVRTWFLRFLCLKHDSLHSGLMTARLSVHCTLKRVQCRNYRLCTLTSTLKRTTFIQHALKNFFVVQSAVWCFSLQTFITLTRPQCQETNVRYV